MRNGVPKADCSFSCFTNSIVVGWDIGCMRVGKNAVLRNSNKGMLSLDMMGEYGANRLGV